jgi:hypothetical protein
MKTSAISPGFALLAISVVACAPALEPRDDQSGDPRDAGGRQRDAGASEVIGKFSHHELADGALDTVVDATLDSEWQYLDLDTRTADDDEARWDLGFSRFRIRVNGGAGGPGGVEVAALADADFDALERAPDQGFAPARPDGDEDEDSEPDTVFNSGPEDWYAYDVMKHTLSPLPIVYAIASSEQRFYKLRIDGYYDDAGTPGFLRFRWAAIAEPAASRARDGGAAATDGGTDMSE